MEKFHFCPTPLTPWPGRPDNSNMVTLTLSLVDIPRPPLSKRWGIQANMWPCGGGHSNIDNSNMVTLTLSLVAIPRPPLSKRWGIQADMWPCGGGHSIIKFVFRLQKIEEKTY